MGAIYERADDSPTEGERARNSNFARAHAELRLDLLAERVHDGPDFVGAKAAAREKGVQPSATREVVEPGERFPLFLRHAPDGCGGIDALAFTQLRDRLIGNVARDPLSHQLEHDAATRGAGREQLGAGELAREVGVVEQLLIAEASDHRFDIGGGRTLLKQFATKFLDGSRAKAKEMERSIISVSQTLCHWSFVTHDA
jgi:hypothetical protein